MGWSFLDFTGLSHFFGKLPEKLVTTETTQTISGTKSFSSTILGSVSGSAASASKDGAGNVIADTYETKADAAAHLSKSDAAGTYLSKTDAASGYVQTGAVDQTVGGTKTFSKPIAGSVTGSSGSCTGNAATATQFSANATVALTGDATGTSAGSKKGWSVPVTLANSGVTAGTYGPSADVTGNNNATISVPEITVDAKGRVTSVTNRTLTCKNNTYNVYNKTLTIQKNGTNVATFTSNSNTDVTANITVPTKTSELTNDSGYLTSHQSLSNYVTLDGAQTISGAKTFTGDVIGINKENSTEDANSLYSATAGSKLTYYTTSNGGTDLANVPAAVNTTLESRTIRRLSDSDWIVEQICHNSTGLYYRKGSNGTWGAWKTFAFTDSNISGNAATATKLAAKRTIALSGAATGTATNFDGSGNITIPVTALSGSAITSAITIYDLVPDGAANHRNFYRGKDLTAAFNAGTVSEHIADGTFRDIFPGDYITKSITVPQILKAGGTTEYIAQKTYTVKFIIADLDIWLNRGDSATTAHHVAIVPERVVFNSIMNETNTTEGGYLGSFMNTNVMPAFAAGLQNAFGASHLISFRIGLSNGVTTTTASASHPYWTGTSNWWGAWTSEICCLMSEGMVHGQSPNHSAAMDETMCGQFAAFRLNSSLVYIRQNYWLSDVVSSAHFAIVGGIGSAGTTGASYSHGVRPFALLV